MGGNLPDLLLLPSHCRLLRKKSVRENIENQSREAGFAGVCMEDNAGREDKSWSKKRKSLWPPTSLPSTTPCNHIQYISHKTCIGFFWGTFHTLTFGFLPLHQNPFHPPNPLHISVKCGKSYSHAKVEYLRGVWRGGCSLGLGGLGEKFGKVGPLQSRSTQGCPSPSTFTIIQPGSKNNRTNLQSINQGPHRAAHWPL